MAFHDLVHQSQAHQHRFTLWPRNWAKYDPGVTLDWKVLPFDERSIDEVPEEPGLYAFLIQPKIAPNLNASYLIYVGETERTLKERYREYLGEVRRGSGRPRIVMLLHDYAGFVYFSCTEHSSPKSVEDQLINAYMPPANSKYSGEVARIVAAWT